MSGAVMLLMAATVGITYGWTPDNGNGVKYIIQIPPEKMEQVARTGEISSQIPAEVRGHVSEVVIRVGNGNVPRITPDYLSRRDVETGTFNAVAAADQIPMPIPSMGDPTDLRPIGVSASAPTAMMKPAPQSGGMNMPGGFGMTPASNSAPPNTGYGNSGYGTSGYGGAPPPSTGFNNSNLEQAAREAANNVAQQFNATTEASRQQIQQNLNAGVERMGDAANSQFQSATDGIQDAAKVLMYGPVLPPNNADDPRNRLTQSSTSALPPTPASNGPSTAPYASTNSFGSAPPSSSPSAATGGSAGYGAAPTSSSSLPPNMAASTSSTNSYSGPASTPPLNATTRDEDWYALNGSRGRPSTSPVSSSASAFAGGNFGQLPAGLQSAVNSSTSRPNPPSANGGYSSSAYADDTRQTTASSSELDYDPNLSAAQASRLPKNGYSYDAEGYPVDRQGYRLDQYGRRVDRQGHLITAVDSIAESNTPPGSLRDGVQKNTGFTGGPFADNRPAGSHSTSPLVQPPRDRLSDASSERDRYPRNTDARNPDSHLAGLNGGMSGGINGAPRNAETGSRIEGRSRGGEDDLDSSSDGALGRGRFGDQTTSAGSGAGEFDGELKQVAAQPIFNALLLLSVVGNLYLLYWLKNLRVQFREMVAAKRASVSGGSLAGGV